MSKQWIAYGPRPPINPRVMLSLPMESGDTHQVFHDRQTGIYWREDWCVTPSQWSYYKPPKFRLLALFTRKSPCT